MEALPVLDEIIAWLGPLHSVPFQRTCRTAHQAWWQHLAHWLPAQAPLPCVHPLHVSQLRRTVIEPLAAALQTAEWVRPALPAQGWQWAGLLHLWLPDAWRRLSLPAGLFELGGLSAPPLETGDRLPDPRISDLWDRLPHVQNTLDAFGAWRRQLAAAALPLRRWPPALAPPPLQQLARRAAHPGLAPAGTESRPWTHRLVRVRVRWRRRLAAVIVHRDGIYRLFPALPPEQLQSCH
jgi:hypothetical protein